MGGYRSVAIWPRKSPRKRTTLPGGHEGAFLTSTLLLGVFLCISSLNVSASTAVVTPPNTAPCRNVTSFNTISQAIAHVPAGSTIYICPGTYAEQIVITKKLTLIGESANGLAGGSASGAENPVILSPTGGVVVNAADLYDNSPIAAQIAVLSPGGTVNVSNLTIDGSNNDLSGCGTNLVGVLYQNASGTINHVVTRYQELDPSDFGCQDGLAIFVQSGYSSGGTATVTIEDSSVHDYDKNGITADGSGTVATITGNYVAGIGATPLTAQNGIQVSFGAAGAVKDNTVTDDVYVNPADCGMSNSCYSATGILLYDSGGTNSSPVTISGNTVSNTQGAIVAVTDGGETADYNNVTSNKISTNAAIVVTGATYLLDGIDLCSNNNTATSNTVYNSSGAGVHLDSECSEPGGAATGIGTATHNTVNEACTGVLLGNSGGTQSGTIAYNVVETSYAGDSCPVGYSAKTRGKAKPQPRHR